MTPTVSARDRVLDAFETLLIEHGERGATLDATAALAGVSKGGLLYHFGNRGALIEGLLERLSARAEADAHLMASAPAGSIDYLLRTSVYTGEDFDRTMIAVTRLAQSEDSRAGVALAAVRRTWLDLIQQQVQDPAVAETIMLVSDGLYMNSTLDCSTPAEAHTLSSTSIDEVLAVVARLY
ncbi:TetR/AcrR family transcriptional regulator [Mycetocola spongiae]|uniref:TetR/AcrR family transcriptional regulator n=1 Tax=Mycetocola spongiae TaxID=2859226 RepID=UPI001CF2E5FE|nr:TetR/AcrR family transcriptional regulator [Mycetocola spongiae]